MSTPMMKQYEEIKSKNEDAILLFRLGDFYEMFGDDAVKASRILDITLTARNKGENKIPMCGVPYHAIDNYLPKLTKAGEKVAICDQVSDPKLPGIVERAVTRIVTPGTTLSTALLETNTNNFICFISERSGAFGLAYADISTGNFAVSEVNTFGELLTEISKIFPAECLLSSELYDSESGTILRDSFDKTHFFIYDTFLDAETTLKEHFKVSSLTGFGLAEKDMAVLAGGNLLNYLIDTQKRDLTQIQKIRYFSVDENMPIDEATLRNLELIYTIRDRQKEGSLLSVIDKTLTAMGGRLLKYWLLHPLLSADKIKIRLDAVEELKNNNALLTGLREIIKSVPDIERIIARIAYGTGNARDLVSLKKPLASIPDLKSLISDVNSEYLAELHGSFKILNELIKIIESSISDDAPLTVREGGMIKDGYNSELDAIKNISREGKNFIKNLQEKEIKNTGISTLKVRFNKVFGYYIEVSKGNIKNVPDSYIRKQTLVNAERYITPELKEYEDKVLNAEEKIAELEYNLYSEIRDKTISHIADIQHNAMIIAKLDTLCSFAFCAQLNDYCKPEVSNDYNIEITGGRHPVVEKMTFSGDFIPNDVLLDKDNNRLLLITGPNMGGKSTILRQTALIVLMAHIGSFVPAEKAVIGLVDRIFTRVGASDNLVKGQSTFMVEMQEAANILNNATENSLIILDEIGRGTSTYDGVSIAWAITEYIHNVIKAKTLFATHYHELISVTDNLESAKNFSVAVKEKKDSVLFLYKLCKGGIDKSYGIEVARLAGLPVEIIEQSKNILKELEEDIVDKNIKAKLSDHRRKISEDQMDIFGGDGPDGLNRESQGLKKLKNDIEEIDINGLTPLEALKMLDEIKRKLQ